jgi:hypothetical protein
MFKILSLKMLCVLNIRVDIFTRLFLKENFSFHNSRYRFIIGSNASRQSIEKLT